MRLTLNSEEQKMCLGDLRKGEWGRVVRIDDERLRVQLMRFGIHDGSRLRCHARLPFGPVVVRYGGQELALGREVARGIEIKCDGRTEPGRECAGGTLS